MSSICGDILLWGQSTVWTIYCRLRPNIHQSTVCYLSWTQIRFQRCTQPLCQLPQRDYSESISLKITRARNLIQVDLAQRTLDALCIVSSWYCHELLHMLVHIGSSKCRARCGGNISRLIILYHDQCCQCVHRWLPNLTSLSQPLYYPRWNLDSCNFVGHHVT